MTETYSQTPEHATRDVETRYLIALMQRDAQIWAERIHARDSIISNCRIIRRNPRIEKAPPSGLSIFEDSYRVLR